MLTNIRSELLKCLWVLQKAGCEAHLPPKEFQFQTPVSVFMSLFSILLAEIQGMAFQWHDPQGGGGGPGQS